MMEPDFDAWYLATRPGLATALLAWCGDEDLAADALDEGFVRALERWDRVQAMDSPQGWVWITATNVVRRRQRRRSAEGRLLAQHMTSEDGVAGSVGDDIDLRRALLRLADRQRTAVVLFYLADLPVTGVAEVMGITTGTVAATLHQARQRLGELLADRAETQDIDGALP